jgi:L-rhamnose-H+ transport protein
MGSYHFGGNTCRAENPRFMLTGVAFGFVTVFLAGLLQGSILAPMKYMPKWAWENIWIVYATFAYLLFPWFFAALTIPHLGSVLAATPHGALVRTLLFGFLWGIAVVTFGLGCELLGLALGYAIILGLGTSIGSLVPLIGQHRDLLWARPGIGTMGGVLLLTVAVIMFSVAGSQREKILKGLKGSAVEIQQKGGVNATFFAGLIVCIICGVLNPLYNIAYAYGAEIQSQAVRFGAAPVNAGNAVWLLITNAGYLPSLIYCLFLLKKKTTWKTFKAGNTWYWLFPPLMGFMWMSGTVLYGRGANLIGSLGPVIGWPLLMSVMVLTANLWGFYAGEWKGVRGAPVRLATGGLTILVAAMFVLGWSSKL